MTLGQPLHFNTHPVSDILVLEVDPLPWKLTRLGVLSKHTAAESANPHLDGPDAERLSSGRVLHRSSERLNFHDSAVSLISSRYCNLNVP
jgi:hypothetical protein